MRTLLFIIVIGLLSFKKDTTRDRLPLLFFQVNSTSYADFYEPFVTPNDTIDILAYVKYVLEKTPTMTIQVVGHADFSEPNKQDLSLRRAKKVCLDIIKLGINSNRITTIGDADTKPRVTEMEQKKCGSDKECSDALKVRNRYVFFVVTHG